MASVDVAVPCYQYGRFLRDCIASVLNQGIHDLRILIIDNASNDGSLEVAQQLAKEDSRVDVLAHRINLGAHASYNAGIDWAAADYFLVLDADDLLAPGCLTRAISVMDQHPDVSFTHGLEVRRPAGEPTWSAEPSHGEATWHISTGIQFIERLCRTPVNIVGSPTVVRRTAAQKLVGHYRPELPYTDDLEMWLRLASVGRVAETSAIQAVRRVHESQASAHYRRVHQVRDFKEREAAFESFFSHEGRSITQAEQLLERARRGLGEHAYWSALSHACRGYVQASIELLAFSRERRPGTGLLPPLSWLLRMDRPVGRMIEIGAEAVGWRR